MPVMPGNMAVGLYGDSTSTGGGGGGSGNSTLFSTLGTLGLTTGLKLCLDAGDANSYGGSGQTWADVSGNGIDFYRGTTSASQSSDPTFNGTPGNSSSNEYWGFNGSQYFSLVAGSNPAWVETLHKDNAIFAFAGWLYHAGTSENLFATDTTSSKDIGVHFAVSSTFPNQLLLFVDNGSSTVLSNHMTATFVSSAWNFFGLRLDEGANTMTMQVGATQETFTATYSSPSSSSSASSAKIGALGDGSARMPSGSRLASIAGWQGTIPSASDLNAIYNVTKAQFGY